MMETLEINYGTDEATDIQSYRQWRTALAAEAFGSVGVAISPKPGTKMADLQFDTDTNFTYAVFHTINLCNWKEIARYRAPHNSTTNFPVSTREPLGFWKVRKLIPRE